MSTDVYVYCGIWPVVINTLNLFDQTSAAWSRRFNDLSLHTARKKKLNFATRFSKPTRQIRPVFQLLRKITTTFVFGTHIIAKSWTGELWLMRANVCSKVSDTRRVAAAEGPLSLSWSNTHSRDNHWILRLARSDYVHLQSVTTRMYHLLYLIYLRNRVRNLTWNTWTPWKSFSTKKKYYFWDLNLPQMMYISDWNIETYRVARSFKISNSFLQCLKFSYTTPY